MDVVPMTRAATVDYTAFRTDPTAEDLARLRQEIAAGDLGPTTQRQYAQRPGIFMFALIAGFLGLIFGTMSLVALIRGNSEDAIIGVFFTGGVVVIAAVAGMLTARSARRSFRDMWRLVTFARVNSFEVQPSAEVVMLPGSIFTTKRHTQTTEQLRWTIDGATAEVANHYRNTDGHGFLARFVAVELGPRVPRLSFSCGVSGIPGSGMGGKEVVITGPDVPGRRRPRRGTLISAPKNSERARELLTEELVELLLDPEYPCNAETAGGYFFAYYSPPCARRTEENLTRHSIALAEAVVRADRRRTASR